MQQQGFTVGNLFDFIPSKWNKKQRIALFTQLKTFRKQSKNWHSESADPAKALVSWLCSNEQKREIND